MNILNQQLLWETLRIHIPMLICAAWVIKIQKKLIWGTLKRWWSWSREWRNWTKERKDYMIMFALGAILFIFALSTHNIRKNLAEKQKQETVERMLEEKVVTREELAEQLKKSQETAKENQELGKKQNPLPLYDASPVLCFVLVCIIAPLGEECVFRYLIFEIFDKNKPLAYIFSSMFFIFLHWTGPAQGLLNFTTIQLLMLTYLPLTFFLIYTYRKSKWNITYPIYFHFLWNLFVFLLTIRSSI